MYEVTKVSFRSTVSLPATFQKLFNWKYPLDIMLFTFVFIDISASKCTPKFLQLSEGTTTLPENTIHIFDNISDGIQVVGLQKVYKKHPPAVSLVLAVVAFFIYW